MFRLPQGFGAQQDTPQSDYAAYRSPLSLYPFLHAHSRPYPIDFEHSIPSGASDLFPPLDRRPGHSDHSLLTGVNLRALKAIAVNKWLSDPSRRVCQYEVPGGGECRDRDCADIHPSLAWTVEPSGAHPYTRFCVAHVFIAVPASFSTIPPLHRLRLRFSFPTQMKRQRNICSLHCPRARR